MAIERLSGERFGFDTRCFVCDGENVRGMQVPFYEDTDAQLVFADFTLDEHFSGAPTLVHGGATLALIDEGMSWATIAIGGKFAFTRETSASFDWPIRLGRPYRLEVRLTERDERRMITEAQVLDAKGRACVSARAVMSILDIGQAADAIGTEIEGGNTRYVR
jgi:acyl-coenzyme A thioesterase PaaI-like protein